MMKYDKSFYCVVFQVVIFAVSFIDPRLKRFENREDPWFKRGLIGAILILKLILS